MFTTQSKGDFEDNRCALGGKSFSLKRTSRSPETGGNLLWWGRGGVDNKVNPEKFTKHEPLFTSCSASLLLSSLSILGEVLFVLFCFLRFFLQGY